MKQILIIILIFSSIANSRVYKLKQNETLSEVAQREIGEPVYPIQNGSLSILLKLNPQIKNKHIVRPNESIILPDTQQIMTPHLTEKIEEKKIERILYQTHLMKKWTPSIGLYLRQLTSIDRNTHGQAQLLSHLNILGKIHYDFENIWTTWEPQIIASFKKEEYTMSGRTLSNPSLWKGAILNQLSRKYLMEQRISFGIQIEQENFLRASNTQTLVFDLIPVASFHISSTFYRTIIHNQPLLFSVGLQNYFPSNSAQQNIISGWGFCSLIKVENKWHFSKNWLWQPTAELRYNNIKTNYIEESKMDLGLTATFYQNE